MSCGLTYAFLNEIMSSWGHEKILGVRRQVAGENSRGASRLS